MAQVPLVRADELDQRLSGLQPLDSDLTAIAALSTTAWGRNLLTLADAAAGRAAMGAEVAGAAAAAQAAAIAASQPLDSDLTAIAALGTTPFGRSLLTLAGAPNLAEDPAFARQFAPALSALKGRQVPGVDPAQAYVAIIFDDGHHTVYDTAYPLMRERGMVGTFAITTDLVGTANYVTWAQIREMEADGWEICSHSKSHANLLNATDAAETDEIELSKAALLANGVQRVRGFVAPYGLYNADTLTKVKKHYEWQRFNGEDATYPQLWNIDRWNLTAYNPGSSLDRFKAKIDRSIYNGMWCSPLFHYIDRTGAGGNSYDTDDFIEFLDYIVSRRVAVGTYSDRLLASTAAQEYAEVAYNGNFADGSGGISHGWTRSAGTCVWSLSGGDPLFPTIPVVDVPTSSDLLDADPTYWSPVTAGDTYILSQTMRADTTSSAGTAGYLFITWYQSNKSTVISNSQDFAITLPTTSYRSFSLEAVAPVGAAYCRIRLRSGASTRCLVANVSFRKKRSLIPESGRTGRATFSNVNYTVEATGSVFVAQTGSMSAARTVTLPAASSFAAGAFITIIDESGTLTSANKIIVARAGADTINGVATSLDIVAPYGSRTFISDGTSKWTCSPESVSANGTGGVNTTRIGVSATASGDSGTALGGASQAGGLLTTAAGFDARATTNYSTAIGAGSRAISGAGGVAVGYSATAAGGTGSTAMGYAANASQVESLALGGSAAAGGAGSLAIGAGASVAAGQTDGIAIGRGAAVTAGSGENIAIGGSAAANEWRATALGFRARATAISSTAIGRRAYAGGTHAIALGRGAWTTIPGSIAIGFSGGDGAVDVYFESGHTHKYVDEDTTTITRNPSLVPIVVHGFDAFDATGSPTNNVAGGPLVLAAGRGTGTAIGGAVKLQVAPAGGASNNTKNALVTVVEAGCSSTSPTLGFFAATPVVKPTGVAVTAGAIHAALVSLGLIAA